MGGTRADEGGTRRCASRSCYTRRSAGGSRARLGSRGASAVHPTAPQGNRARREPATGLGVGLSQTEELPMSTTFDPLSSAFRADPFPAFRHLQLEDPVHRCDALGGWILTRYADVLAALRDPRLSADRISPF